MGVKSKTEGRAKRPSSWNAKAGGKPSPGQLLTTDELAERLNVTAHWVNSHVWSGTIPYVKIGMFVRFEADAIDAWLAEQRRDPAT